MTPETTAEELAGGCCAGSCRTGGCPPGRAFDWLSGLERGEYARDQPAVEVRFKGQRKGYYRNADDIRIAAGDMVVVEADRGVDLGMVSLMGELVRIRIQHSESFQVEQLPRIVRLATDEDMERAEANREQEREAFEVGRRMVEKLELPMNISDVEWQFDRNKVTLFFTAERRVDFRKLVRELAGKFRTRVELRQIGARDEAARLGGLATCGREFCCSTWLPDFAPVAMHAAKVQDLPLNPVRLGGQCGRLKCCLNFELEQYVQALKHLPRVGKSIQTAQGKAQVLKVDIFRSRVTLRYSDGTVVELASDQVARA